MNLPIASELLPRFELFLQVFVHNQPAQPRRRVRRRKR
jgi:hypothetical protein